MTSNTIAAVVVTFNRKKELLACINGLINQSQILNAILIIDNCSSDGTEEDLFKHNYITELPTKKENHVFKVETKLTRRTHQEEGNIQIIYLRLPINTGGAGGFYEGIKLGDELNFDWLWLMDDDGIPDKEALKELLKSSSKANFLNSLVLNIKNKNELSFDLKANNSYKNLNTIDEAIHHAQDGLIYNQANPFNGTLISKAINPYNWISQKRVFHLGRRSGISIKG
jgi:rhamnopyranosyl-N-acetylglucosaminyl-diphospho-decaprenol beta-1,3/1,4-galactofuranosyltransferase